MRFGTSVCLKIDVLKSDLEHSPSSFFEQFDLKNMTWFSITKIVSLENFMNSKVIWRQTSRWKFQSWKFQESWLLKNSSLENFISQKFSSMRMMNLDEGLPSQRWWWNSSSVILKSSPEKIPHNYNETGADVCQWWIMVENIIRFLLDMMEYFRQWLSDYLFLRQYQDEWSSFFDFSL